VTSMNTPWPPVNDMIDLRPGTVTTIASLPTAGRSTLTLNMALHNALQGTCTLYTSTEINGEQLTEKTVTALYGIDLRHRETPIGGWDAFSARTKAELGSIPLYLHAAAQETPEEAFEAGTANSARRQQKVRFWVVDSLAHVSPFVADGEGIWDFEQSMTQLRRIAEREQLAVVVTARADNEAEHEPLVLKHVPPAIVELSDQVLMLHREGVYWTTSASDDATITRLKPQLDGAVTLRLLPRLCRFSHFGINV
jgi:predicted ATP-dependent serine protease